LDNCLQTAWVQTMNESSTELMSYNPVKSLSEQLEQFKQAEVSRWCLVADLTPS